MIKHISYFTLAFSFCTVFAHAQMNRVTIPPRNSVSVNQPDLNGYPHGVWVISQPAEKGEPGFTEFGMFDHGSKTGIWHKIDQHGEMMASENYRNNVLDGEVKYYYNGILTAKGVYRGLNPEKEYDTIMVEDPVTGLQRLKAVHNDRYTVRHGAWKYYDYETGKLVREEEYQVDSIIYSKEFSLVTIDSALYKKREANMPHNKKKVAAKPAAVKQTGYIK